MKLYGVVGYWEGKKMYFWFGTSKKEAFKKKRNYSKFYPYIIFKVVEEEER